MLKIESNLKINGRHWGLQFADGIAYTANVALAAKLLLKGYVVTDQQPEAVQTVAGDINVKQTASTTPASPRQEKSALQPAQPDQPVAGSISKEHELSLAPSSPAQADTVQTEKQSEHPVSTPDVSVSISGSSASKTVAEPAKPKTTKPRKRAVDPHAADAG